MTAASASAVDIFAIRVKMSLDLDEILAVANPQNLFADVCECPLLSTLAYLKTRLRGARHNLDGST